MPDPPAIGSRDGLTQLRAAPSLVGRTLVYLPRTTSTNDEARRLARTGAANGTVVVADYQTAGRGRLGRRWEAPPGSSLLYSVLLRPVLQPWQAQRVTMICGLAVLDALEQVTGLSAQLKWPNDILLGDAKLGGILTQVEVEGDRLDYVIVGIGLNVNLDPSILAWAPPSGVEASGRTAPPLPGTSCSYVLGHPVPRFPLLRSFLAHLDRRYATLQAGRSPQSEWAARLATLGHAVRVFGAGPVVDGYAEGVDDDGALLVRIAGGRLLAIVAGDVTLRTGADWYMSPTSAIMPAAG